MKQGAGRVVKVRCVEYMWLNLHDMAETAAVESTTNAAGMYIQLRRFVRRGRCAVWTPTEQRTIFLPTTPKFGGRIFFPGLRLFVPKQNNSGLVRQYVDYVVLIFEYFHIFRPRKIHEDTRNTWARSYRYRQHRSTVDTPLKLE